MTDIPMTTGAERETAFDPSKPFTTHDGWAVTAFEATGYRGLVDGEAISWDISGRSSDGDSMNQLVNVPPAAPVAQPEASDPFAGHCCIPRPGEPFFVLLGRDRQAPAVVEQWARARELAKPGDDKIAGARDIAAKMRAYAGTAPVAQPGTEDAEVERLREILQAHDATVADGHMDDDWWRDVARAALSARVRDDGAGMLRAFAFALHQVGNMDTQQDKASWWADFQGVWETAGLVVEQMQAEGIEVSRGFVATGLACSLRTAAPEQGADNGWRPIDEDEVARDELKSRAIELLALKGWKPGDRFGTHSVVQLLIDFGLSVSDNPPSRCNYPNCGCDNDASCAGALPPTPVSK